MLRNIIGSKKLRPNRLFDGFKSQTILAKLPREIACDEYNVVFGMGRILMAIGGTVTFTQNAPRDLILRKLVLSGELTPDASDLTVTAVTVEGNTCLLGAGASGATFGPTAINNPDFDLPVSGGTPITLTVVNNNAAQQAVAPAFTID